jgi:ribosomal protein L9
LLRSDSSNKHVNNFCNLKKQLDKQTKMHTQSRNEEECEYLKSKIEMLEKMSDHGNTIKNITTTKIVHKITNKTYFCV